MGRCHVRPPLQTLHENTIMTGTSLQARRYPTEKYITNYKAVLMVACQRDLADCKVSLCIYLWHLNLSFPVTQDGRKKPTYGKNGEQVQARTLQRHPEQEALLHARTVCMTLSTPASLLQSLHQCELHKVMMRTRWATTLLVNVEPEC